MPIYDFQCNACGCEFEGLVHPNETPECPACHSPNLERLLSSFAVASPEKRQAAADVKRKKAVETARQINFERDRESERHKREEH